MASTISKRPLLPLDKTAPVLASHIRSVKSRVRAVAIQKSLAIAAVVILAWLVVELPLDWFFDLPRWARATGLCAALFASVSVIVCFGFRPWRKGPSDDSVALSIERAIPQFQTRFIASVQLSRHAEDASRSFVKALVRDTVEIARGLSFEAIVNTGNLQRWRRIATLGVLAVAVIATFGGPDLQSLLRRAWLASIPVPRNTQIVAFTGDRVIALGDDLRIEATIAGVVPTSGMLFLKSASGNIQQFTMDADPLNKSRFFRSLQSVQDGFTYRLRLGDSQTGTARIDVRPRPAILNLTCEQQWPPYTKRPPQPRPPGSLKLFAGSDLAVRLSASVPLREASLQLIGTESGTVLTESAFKPVSSQKNSFPDWHGTVRIPATGATGITFRLVDQAGVESKGLAVYRLEVIPDEPPSIRILWPQRREELATANAILLVGFEAKDDFGIDAIRLHYASNWTQGASHRTIELDLNGNHPTSVNRRFEWKIDRLKPPLSEGDVLDYWFEVVDNNNVTGPGLTILPGHYQVRIVSEAEKRLDLANRLNETLRSLDDVKTGQDNLATQLGEIIREKQ